MNRVTLKLLCFSILALFSCTSILAYDPYATGSAVVSASIVSLTFDPPQLVSPNQNSVSRKNREQFVWKRPSPVPVTPLHHYDFYLDDQVIASSVSDSITTQTYYFYTIRRDNDTFYLDLLTDLTEGYHTWRVVAYNTAGTSASSETRTFYLDFTDPFISLEKVDRQTLSWNTARPDTIPDINLRDIVVYTQDPLLTGSVESYANMQFILMCPQNIHSDCHDQIWQGNYPTGSWQHRFYGLTKGFVYTVYLSATDAAGNSTIFPEFYLAYGLVAPTPSAIITPTPSTPPEIPVTPTTTPEIEVIPTPFVPVPPVAPTPPLFNNNSTPVKTFNYLPILIILLLIGLPLHLFMALYGSKTSLIQFPKLIFILLFPFIGHKKYQTTPFTTIKLYDPNNLDHSWQTQLSDINGFYSLKTNLPEKLFVKISCTGRIWKNVILQTNLLSTSCLFSIPENPLMPSDRLHQYSLTLRSLALILAIAASALCLYLQPSYLFLIYLYLSLQLAFSEYLYPHISK